VRHSFWLAGGIGVVAVMSAQPAIAQGREIVGVELQAGESGLVILLDVPGEAAPRFFPARFGDTFFVDIPETQLRLPGGESFQQANPAEGIESVSVEQITADTVRVRVVGAAAAPRVETRPSGLAVVTTSGAIAEATPDVSDAPPDDPEGIEEPVEEPVDAEETTADGDEVDGDEIIEIVVTATRTEELVTEVPRAVTTVTREDIAEQSLLTNDLTEILAREVPGFGPPSGDGRTRVQKLRGRRALILIDGVPQNTNTTFDTELSSIAPDAIERIEVVRGPSAVYGDGATGGVVNIITRAPAEEGIEQSVGLGTRINNPGAGFTGQYGISGREGQFDFRLNGSYDVEPLQNDANNNRIPPDGLSTDTENLNLLAKVGYDITPEQRIQFTYNIFNTNYESDFISDPAVLVNPELERARALEVGDINYDDVPEKTVQNFSLTYRHEDIISSQVDAIVYFRDTDLVQIPADIRGRFPPTAFPAAPRLFQTTLDASELGARLQFDSTVSETLSILWGADYAREENESLFNALDPEAFDNNREANVIDRPTQTPFYTLENIGLFAQLTWDVTSRLIFSGGLRYESINADIDDYTASPFSDPAGQPADIEGGDIDDSDVAFNAGLVYEATPNLNLFFNFSQGFSIPQLSSVLGFASFGTSIDGDSIELETQKVDNFELGVRGNWRDIELSLVGFFNHSELGSALIVDPDVGTTTVRAPQENYGIEFTVDWEPSDRWRLGSILTWNEGNFEPNDDGEFVALSSVDVQPLTLTLYLENETLPGWRNRIQGLLVTDRDRAFEDDVDQFDVDGYFLVDLISQVELGAAGRLGRLEFGISNLFDVDYFPVSSQERIGIQEVRRFAGAGRSFALRYVVDF